jgi:hypothetical protein
MSRSGAGAQCTVHTHQTSLNPTPRAAATMPRGHMEITIGPTGKVTPCRRSRDVPIDECDLFLILELIEEKQASWATVSFSTLLVHSDVPVVLLYCT